MEYPMRFHWSLAAAAALLTGAGAATNAALRRPGAPRSAPPGGDRTAPELTNPSWLNVDHPLRLAELRGRVVELGRRYRADGLSLIGIHTPEFPPYSGEHDKSNVARALAKQSITYPNAQDNDRRTWDAYGIRFWPSFVLIDKQGTIRFTGYGEFHPDDADFHVWDQRIRELLAE